MARAGIALRRQRHCQNHPLIAGWRIVRVTPRQIADGIALDVIKGVLDA